MLIKCPECNNDISDKANFCPHCGLPMARKGKAPFRYDAPPNKRRAHPKLPNGFGSIQKLPGRRRNPYAVYKPLKKSDYDDNGYAKKVPLGYFETYNDAYLFLSEWHVGRKVTDLPTFSEIYDKWYDKELSDANKSKKNAYQSAYNYCKSLYDIPIDNIHSDEIQGVIDSCGKGFSTRSNIKGLCSKLFQYCISNAILTVNYATYVNVGKNDNEKGVPLSKEEISRLWSHSDDLDVRICLIYIYTGYRLQELKVCDIDIDNSIMTGGVKNENSKNRIVPIHPLIYDFVKEFNQEEFIPTLWRKKNFVRVRKEYGFEYADNGEYHTPHDFRHTFSALCDEYGVDPMCKRILMGHAKGSDVSDNVYGHRSIEQLRKEIEKIKKGQ